MTTERTTYEPPLVTGILSAIVAIAGIVIAAVSLILMFAWLTGWMRMAPMPLIALGWLLFIRFTRDDRNVAGRIASLEMDCADYEVELVEADARLVARDIVIAGLRDDVSHLRDLLANRQSTLTIVDRTGERTIPRVARNEAWASALAMVRMTVDQGVLPGRDKTGFAQDLQLSAIQVLQQAKVIITRGTINRLTVTREKAIDALNYLAQDTPAPIRQPEVNHDATSYPEPELSGLVLSGEGVSLG